ncbi:hypothetical protein [Streptomyces sp. NPDC127108]|uniref:hypothetical protein n=1 Tax=Streptomyces sp. NPDC127108 TaxID=3345361 RepID=UPI00363E1AD6
MSAPDPAAAAPWPEAARARLALAYEAYELAELARAAVPVGPDELRPDGTRAAPGSALADAVRLLGAAHRLLAAAAVYERAAGADWRAVGAALEVARASGEPEWWRSHLLREPLEAARDLDDWVLRHQDGESGLGAAPVSGPLLRHARHSRP